MGLPKSYRLPNGVVYVELTEALKQWAQVRFEKMKAQQSRSRPNTEIGGWDASLMGYIGEAVFLNCYRLSDVSWEDSHDFVHNGLKIDVKTTGATSGKAKDLLEVAELGVLHDDLERYKPDIYAFILVDRNMAEAYMMGYAAHHQVKERFKFRKRGEKTRSGKIYTTDCWAATRKMLNPPIELLDLGWVPKKNALDNW